MKTLFTLIVLFCAAVLRGETAPPAPIVITGPSSNFLIKMTSSVSTTASKPGDPVTGVIIVPVELRGGRVEGTVLRADNAILRFAFHTVKFNGRTLKIQSEVTSVVSSKGNAGQDDLGQRVRMDGGGIIAYGTASAIDEGAEIRFTAWE
ncbi:MAG: hypothetical protein PSV13_19670 [Lacunisphaera sp.]|nr:hypothetical protein [Lacunisphaera sp.]